MEQSGGGSTSVQWQEFNRKVLDRVSKDPDFRERIVKDPTGTLNTEYSKELAALAGTQETGGYLRFTDSWGCG